MVAVQLTELKLKGRSRETGYVLFNFIKAYYVHISDRCTHNFFTLYAAPFPLQRLACAELLSAKASKSPKSSKASPSTTFASTTDDEDDVTTVLSNTLEYVWDDGNSLPGNPQYTNELPACLGDCDRDSDCAVGLECFQRNGIQSVPGCLGPGISGKDYCYSTVEEPSVPTPEPTNLPVGTLAYVWDNGSSLPGNPDFPNGLTECLGDCDRDR